MEIVSLMNQGVKPSHFDSTARPYFVESFGGLRPAFYITSLWWRDSSLLREIVEAYPQASQVRSRYFALYVKREDILWKIIRKML